MSFFYIGDVSGPYFWKGFDSELTSDNLVSKTFAPAEGALLGFSSMIYNIIYMRQGHGAKAFSQDQLYQLLIKANIGNNIYNILSGK